MSWKAKVKQAGGRRAVAVYSLNPRATRGTVVWGTLRFPCALGRTGSCALKREGDGATPIGTWPLREVFYRADRLSRPRCLLPVRRLQASDGWCDAPADRNYNRRVRHPYPASAERMWRVDGLYDVVLVLGHNDQPRVRGHGSAIFMHVARADYAPTEGCIALALPHLLALLARLGPRSVVRVRQKSARSMNSGR